MLKFSGSLALATTALLGASAAPAQAPGEERLVTAGELAAMVAKTENGRAAQNIWSGKNYLLMTSVRLVPGTAELHDRMADMFIVQTGSADVTIGGTLSGDAVTGPGERRGGQITGGHVRHIGPGDVLWIPAGAPHLVTPAKGPRFRYLVVKIADGAGEGK